MNSELQVVLEPGIAQKLQFAINRNDGTYEDVEYLSTGKNFHAITLLRTGKAKLVEITETGSESKVIPTTTTPPTYAVDAEGNIHFTVISNGRTGEECITYFENEKKDAKGKPYRVSDYGKSVLRNAPAPTNGITYNIVVRPGKKISDSDRITKKIRAAADKKGWLKPHWEVACLIRDTFTDEQLEAMGLWYIVTMHEPIKDSDGGPSLLRSYRDGGGRWLNADYGRPDGYWYGSGGFAFAVPQVGPQT